MGVRFYRNGERFFKEHVINRPLKDVDAETKRIADELNSYGISLIALSNVVLSNNNTTVIQIEDYDAFSSYSLSVTVGSVTRSADQISWTIPDGTDVGTVCKLTVTKNTIKETFTFTTV